MGQCDHVEVEVYRQSFQDHTGLWWEITFKYCEKCCKILEEPVLE